MTRINCHYLSAAPVNLGPPFADPEPPAEESVYFSPLLPPVETAPILVDPFYFVKPQTPPPYFNDPVFAPETTSATSPAESPSDQVLLSDAEVLLLSSGLYVAFLMGLLTYTVFDFIRDQREYKQQRESFEAWRHGVIMQRVDEIAGHIRSFESKDVGLSRSGNESFIIELQAYALTLQNGPTIASTKVCDDKIRKLLTRLLLG